MADGLLAAHSILRLFRWSYESIFKTELYGIKTVDEKRSMETTQSLCPIVAHNNYVCTHVNVIAVRNEN